MRIPQNKGQRGSQKWLQQAVEQDWPDLGDPILAALPPGRRIKWLSPLVDDDYAEYRDGSFLVRLGLPHLSGALDKFWPRRGAVWDGLACTDHGEVLLVEAKAHIGEFCSGSCQAEATASIAQIKQSLAWTANAIGASDLFETVGFHAFYQYANRLAHVAWLKDQGVEAYLVLVGFVHDGSMPGTTTHEAWEAAYKVADQALGIPRKHPLSASIIHVNPSVMGR